ncbi:protein enabled homolog [Leguminivora glycinivorella]|uniref:protein enabled homolog n=1 Tax=Leguminivora glycinivorella TaxID=1035111 RepID=UPI00200EBD24|nr:protein enabled homolog [Leguminivora glycinivorella]
MQQLQRELKTANELNTKLLQEQEECEQEIESVVRTNTSLKAQLATQDVEFEDMQGQRDELQAIVDRFKQCQEIHEQALQRIQDLEQQLEESEAKMTCKYCSGQARPTDNNLMPGSGYPLRMESPRPTTRPVEPESPALRAALAAPGTPSLRALFAKRLSLASEPRRDPEPAVRTAASPPSRSRLAEPAPPPPPRAVESAPSPPSLAKLALALLTYVEPSPSPPATAPPPPPGAAPCRAPATAPAPPPRPRPRAARTVLYSDEAGVGLGALLAERLHHRVINDCHPGATVDRLIECISAGEFDCDSTLVVFIGNSVDCTKRDILKLSATLSKVDREEVAKIIICALPYRMSSKVNKRVFHYNSLLYNLALYSSTISYFDTNKFIDEFVMPYKKTYLPRRCLVECADLLAYNIKGPDVASTAFNNNMKRFNFSCPGSEGFEMKPSGDLNLN